jgi:hypothetical protein
LNFLHQFCPSRKGTHNNTCLAYTKFNVILYGYKLSFFLGAYRFTWFGALSRHN